MKPLAFADLRTALFQPQALPAWAPAQWDRAVPQARTADLLARVAGGAERAGVLAQLPAEPLRHLVGALKLAQRQAIELRNEVAHVAAALAPIGVPVVLLKGAAYSMLNLPAAQGRLVSDIDILVPRQRLADVESALMIGGWVSTHRDDYDQRYYRRWMHELPPLRHVHRGTVLDVHHAIAPLSSRWHPDAAKLLAASQPIAGDAALRALADVDLLLHSALHLYLEGELERGLRGLIDIFALLDGFQQDPTFLARLQMRADELGLQVPLAWALRYMILLLQQPVGDELRRRWPQADPARPVGAWQRCQDAMFVRGLAPPHASTSDIWSPVARAMLYLRGHLQRMPLWRLVPHLVRKAGRAWFHQRKSA